MYQQRVYRNLTQQENQPVFKVVVKETDLYVYAPKHLEKTARDLILECRGYIESYIKRYPAFAKALTPWTLNSPEPLIIQDMCMAGQRAGVGPMASVAGAVAEYVGKGLLSHTDQVIVENGGDIFIKNNASLVVGIFAGQSPLSLKVGLRIDSGDKPVAVCTSSGTVGHSLSMGNADAVCVVSDSCPVGDASATAIGNQVKSEADIPGSVDFGKTIPGVTGIVIIKEDKFAAWGNVEIVPIK